MRTTKNPRFNHFASIVCGVLRCDEDSTPTYFQPRTSSQGCEHEKSRKISGDLRIIFLNVYFNFRTKNMQGQ